MADEAKGTAAIGDCAVRNRGPLPRCDHGMAPGFCVVAGCPHEERRLGPTKTTASRRKFAKCRKCGAEGATLRYEGGRYCGPCQRALNEQAEAR